MPVRMRPEMFKKVKTCHKYGQHRPMGWGTNHEEWEGTWLAPASVCACRLWMQCDQLPHTAPLSLTARYSGRYSSSCEPKHTLLLFRDFYQVIWSQGQEHWLIYRKVLDGGQHVPLPPSGPPCRVLSPPLYFLLSFVLFF